MVRATKSKTSTEDVIDTKTQLKSKTSTEGVIDTKTQLKSKTSTEDVIDTKTQLKSKNTGDVATHVVVSSKNAVTDVIHKDPEPLDVDNVEIETVLNTASLEFLAKLNCISLSVSALKNDYRILEKKWSKELKIALKASAKRKKKAGNRAPSGFVKPTRISDELASFLTKPIGTEMARTEVTREINDYIRKNQLQDKSNGRKINADAPLMSLLKLEQTDELTYFNLQKFMSPHFYKMVKPVVVV
jgi:chromatin remodeling complex protein RSC6